MNSTIEAVKQLTQEQTRQLTTAMEFIPEERRCWRPEGCAKTPQEIYLECAATYLWAAKLLQGEPADWGQLVSKTQDYTDFERAKELMEQWQSEFIAVLERLEGARLTELVDPGWGDKMPMGQFLLLPSYHSCYHAGQLNYVQTLLGDAEIHF